MLLEQQIEREQSSHGELKNKLTTIRSDNKAKQETISSSTEEMDTAVEESKEDVAVEKKDSVSHPETIMESSEEEEEGQAE